MLWLTWTFKCYFISVPGKFWEKKMLLCSSEQGQISECRNSHEWKLQVQASSNHSFPTHCLYSWYCSGNGRNYMAIWSRITCSVTQIPLSWWSLYFQSTWVMVFPIFIVMCLHSLKSPCAEHAQCLCSLSTI